MPRYCSKKIIKRRTGGSLEESDDGRSPAQHFAYQADPQATKVNKINETVLVREINKAIKKTKSRPIDTSKLIKNE